MIIDKRLDYKYMQTFYIDNYIEEKEDNKEYDNINIKDYQIVNENEVIETYWMHGKTNKEIEEIINDRKDYYQDEVSNLWKYVKDISYIFDCGYLSEKYAELNFKLIEGNEEKWYEWFKSIPYLEIKLLALIQAPSLEFIIEIVNKVSNDSEIKLRNKQEIIVLLIQHFIDIANTIQNNMINANRAIKSKNENEGWNISEWKENEFKEKVNKVFEILLNSSREIYYPIIISVLSNIWIMDKNKEVLFIFREYILDVVIKNTNLLKSILMDDEFGKTKIEIYHKIRLYVDDKENNKATNEIEEDIRLQLINSIFAAIENQKYINYPLDFKEDEAIFMWYAAELFCEDNNVLNSIKQYIEKRDVRLDGWKYEYEKSSKIFNEQCYIMSIAAMSVEWLIMRNNYDTAYELYNFLWRFGHSYIKRTYNSDTEDVNSFLLQLWCRLIYFIENKELKEKLCCDINDFILEGLENIDNIEQKYNVILVLINNIEYRKISFKLNCSVVLYLEKMFSISSNVIAFNNKGLKRRDEDLKRKILLIRKFLNEGKN
ncbi:hypothetical protein ACQPVA_02880 [Clostridium butyricum]|uniref:hypothetical protein n=1 Tax=Clostridium butyricum TaxID=1492 RepID=UPI003D33BEF2